MSLAPSALRIVEYMEQVSPSYYRALSGETDHALRSLDLLDHAVVVIGMMRSKIGSLHPDIGVRGKQHRHDGLGWHAVKIKHRSPEEAPAEPGLE